MDLGLAALALLHILIFVYWLGGDLGAFVASQIVTDGRQPPAARAAAASVLTHVDMAPRTALILAAPTGIVLGAAKGWLPLPPIALALIVAAGLAWLAIAWTIHLRHAPPKAMVRQVDLGLRWAAVAALIAAPFILQWPLFLALKAGLLAGCILAGLAIRAALAPFGPAFATMMRSGATAETDAAIAGSLARARPMVVVIWIFIVAAAFLGVATPTA